MNSTGTPGGSGIPAGWYDDPSGLGLRWWDGEQWTEHVHTAESAAAAAGSADVTSGRREGAPPRDLVKLRESIRSRGAKTVGMFLGAIVLVIVVVALLVSGGSDDAGAGSGSAVPGLSGTPAADARSRQAARKVVRIKKQIRRLSKGDGDASKAKLKALRTRQRALEKVSAGGGDAQAQVNAAKKSAKAASESAE